MLSWLTSIKQCFDMLGSKLTDYIKCRQLCCPSQLACGRQLCCPSQLVCGHSNCCNNINVYEPKNCGILGDASNRFIRAITPKRSKLKSNSDEFYTPKN